MTSPAELPVGRRTNKERHLPVSRAARAKSGTARLNAITQRKALIKARQD